MFSIISIVNYLIFWCAIPLTDAENTRSTAIVIGAGDSGLGSSVEYWPKLSNSTCKNVSDLPISVFSHSAASLGNNVYTCGGSDLPSYLNQCYMVDVSDGGNWVSSAPMITNRSDFSLVRVSDYLFAIGGLSSQGSGEDTIEVFDGLTWKLANMKLKIARFGHCSVQINDMEILVMGGGGNGHHKARFSSVELLNVVDGTSIQKTEMTMTRQYFGCSYVKEENRVYVSGGWGTTCLVEYLDLSSWQWKRVANLNVCRDSHQMETISGKLTVFGGVGHDYVYKNSVEQYDFGRNIWEEVKPMQVHRSSMATTVINC